MPESNLERQAPTLATPNQTNLTNQPLPTINIPAATDLTTRNLPSTNTFAPRSITTYKSKYGPA